MAKQIESKTAKTVLQSAEEVTIGKQTYIVSPPSTATLILVSEAVAQLPAIKLDTKEILTESLRIAKDCRVIGEIVAILILGAKNITHPPVSIKTLFSDLIARRKAESRKRRLANKVLTELTPKELSALLSRLLSGMQVSFFFGTSTSLIDINLLRQTRNIETTASGLS